MRNVLISLIGLALFFSTYKVFSQDNPLSTTPVATLTASDLEMEKKQLEIERLQLENEKLKLDMEKMKFQGTQTPWAEKKEESQNNDKKKEQMEAFQADATKKAQDAAQKNKDTADLLVVDFANGEGWYKGVRYGLNEIFTLAEDQKWPISKKVESRKISGTARNLYAVKNLTLLRYEDMSRGIVKLDSPQKEGDLRILTPDGISFDSGVGDVRNAFQNVYFSYEGQDKRDGLRVLRYNHDNGLGFADKLEVLIDKEGKIKSIRYGVLDEH